MIENVEHIVKRGGPALVPGFLKLFLEMFPGCFSVHRRLESLPKVLDIPDVAEFRNSCVSHHEEEGDKKIAFVMKG